MTKLPFGWVSCGLIVIGCGGATSSSLFGPGGSDPDGGNAAKVDGGSRTGTDANGGATDSSGPTFEASASDPDTGGHTTTDAGSSAPDAASGDTGSVDAGSFDAEGTDAGGNGDGGSGDSGSGDAGSGNEASAESGPSVPCGNVTCSGSAPVCCVSSAAGSGTCVSDVSACAGVPVACASSADCDAGVCCATRMGVNVSGVACTSTCKTPDLELCVVGSDPSGCPMGVQCVKSPLADYGICL